jgi:hypothetical protein
MPYARRYRKKRNSSSYYRRRKLYKARRTYRRRTGNKYNLYRGLNSGNQITLVLKDLVTPLIHNNSLNTDWYMRSFRVNEFQGWTNWKALYDRHRVNWVKVTGVPIATEMVTKPFDDNSGASTTTPDLAWIIDRDDKTQPVDFNDLVGRGGCRRQPMTKGFSFTFCPNKLKMVYLSPTDTGYVIDQKKDFVDNADDTVPYYGLKMGVQPASPSQCWGMHLHIAMSITLKDRRG